MKDVIEISLTKKECVEKFGAALANNYQKKDKLVIDKENGLLKVVPEEKTIVIVPFKGDIYKVILKDPNTNPNTKEFEQLKKKVGLL